MDDGRHDAYAVTRHALHGVAELLLAGPQHRRSGTIRLRVTPGGFGTVAEPELRVEGLDLVSPRSRVAMDGVTYADLGAALGLAAGAPQDLYSDGSGAALADVVRLDPDATRALATALATGDAALHRLDPTQPPVLWPEHFDVGISLDEVNYGVSSGDGYLPEPYAYVGPWRPRTGGFWSAPFGAARPLAELGQNDADAVLAFFHEGRRRAAEAT
ncbi:MAG TPA: hypothetical protein VIM19_17360 [Actinomycetes bacterium]